MTPTPFDAHRGVVRPEWIDANGHLNMGYYVVAFDLATDAWLAGIYFWKWYADLGWGGSRNSDFTPRSKPAERVMADWYRSMASPVRPEE